MSRIYWDSNLFIYLFEGYGKDSERATQLRKRMLERGDQLFTSALTLGEVTVKALRNDQFQLASRYESAILASAVVVAFGVEESRVFARLRADETRKVHPADAIHLACAATAGMDLFLTNDKSLHTLRVPGIQFITSVERAPV